MNSGKRNHPLGFLCPIVLQAELIFSKICILKTGWGSEVPIEIEKSWKLVLIFLKKFSGNSLDQYLFADQNYFVSIELDVYYDASKTACSAVIYARTTFNDKIIVKFANAKSKLVSNKDLPFRE